MASQVSGYIGKINPGNGTNYAIGSTAYGVCGTAAGTAAKTVDMTGFTLATGATIHVKFTYANSAANPTLNVNSTGAKAIIDFTNSPIDSNNTWRGGSIVVFTYDGTNWVRNYAVATSIQSEGCFVVYNTTIAFSANNTYTGYPYRGLYTNSNITANMYAEVVFSLNDANSGNYAPICETIDEGLYIYSKTNTSITVPTIVVFYENAKFDAILDKNFIYVNSSAPTDTTLIWIDTAHSNIAKVYDGANWITVSGAFA